MKTIWQPPRPCAKASQRRWIGSIGLVLAYVLLVAAVLLLLDLVTGCASTAEGLSREQALYRAGTNVVGSIREVVPYLPPPAGPVVTSPAI